MKLFRNKYQEDVDFLRLGGFETDEGMFWEGWWINRDSQFRMHEDLDTIRIPRLSDWREIPYYTEEG